jgi:hypothetical protein
MNGFSCRLPIGDDVTGGVPRPILPKQTAIPDVAPDHLHAPVPGLLHDRPLRRSSDRGAGNEERSAILRPSTGRQECPVEFQ